MLILPSWCPLDQKVPNRAAAVIIKDLHPSSVLLLLLSHHPLPLHSLFKHSRDCLYLVKPDLLLVSFKVKERWLNSAAAAVCCTLENEATFVGLFCKIQAVPCAFIGFAADLKRLVPFLLMYFVFSQGQQKCRKMEYGNGH